MVIQIWQKEGEKQEIKADFLLSEGKLGVHLETTPVWMSNTEMRHFEMSWTSVIGWKSIMEELQEWNELLEE